tara:strand:- start:16 stop:321 length:306 start_codon:yes stop_codon:yes gene_type:complete
MEKNIETNCGIKPKDQEIINIENDPNFVFENDPAFNSITLYDLDGNVVNVNSWTECAHYVNGGWSNINTNSINGSMFVFFGLTTITLFYLIGKKIYATYRK